MGKDGKRRPAGRRGLARYPGCDRIIEAEADLDGRWADVVGLVSGGANGGPGQ